MDEPVPFAPNPDVFYRLTTSFRSNLALDVRVVGGRARPTMRAISTSSNQQWRFLPIAGFPGRFRLTTRSLGTTRAVDVINGGSLNNQL